MKKIPRTIIFILVILIGGIAITFGFQIVFEALDIPYNENLAENRMKRFTEPFDWIEERISGINP